MGERPDIEQVIADIRMRMSAADINGRAALHVFDECAAKAIEALSRKTDVTAEMIEAGLYARVPGGAEVWHWLPTDKAGQQPHQTARNVMRCAIEAAMESARNG